MKTTSKNQNFEGDTYEELFGPRGQITPEHSYGIRRMWIRAMLQTLDDLLYKRGSSRDNHDMRKARAWVFADNVHEGSYLWICEQFNLPPDGIRNYVGTLTPEYCREHGNSIRALLKEILDDNEKPSESSYYEEYAVLGAVIGGL